MSAIDPAPNAQPPKYVELWMVETVPAWACQSDGDWIWTTRDGTFSLSWMDGQFWVGTPYGTLHYPHTDIEKVRALLNHVGALPQ